ncbi:polysaccharide pyruvyl transferase family protein [Mesorhizobium sp. 1B3]|uniref:polysaccharide pyruvyl transferase family protein n=1 Tax=Mesorhizobium sp. 1B3 TaxID=3243599 RepID=UPI003D95A4A4
MTLRSLISCGSEEVGPEPTATNPVGTKRILHIGVHNSANRNAGDTLLFPVVRKTFDTLLGRHEWELRQAWTEFSVEDALRINREFDGIVIGGGGLLLRDQAGSDVSNSGWQWNSTVEAVHAIDIPLIVFAIGYNRFRGQDDFDPVFREHIGALAAKANFFALRNTGSIRALKQYLEFDQAGTLRRQLCPTNVLWQLYPEYRKLAEAHDTKMDRVLAFNAAFDRANLRFGKDAGRVLANVAGAVCKAHRRGWKIVLAAHKTMDRQIEPYLDAAGIDYDTVDLTDAGPREIMTFYAQVDFAFGMRGHAQMIPFGLRRPIMSIISHDKMRFLLDDIEQPTWGVEVDSPDLSNLLDAALAAVESDRQKVHADIAVAQALVWEETVSNMGKIGQVLSNKTDRVNPA